MKATPAHAECRAQLASAHQLASDAQKSARDKATSLEATSTAYNKLTVQATGLRAILDPQESSPVSYYIARDQRSLESLARECVRERDAANARLGRAIEEIEWLRSLVKEPAKS